MQKRKKILAGVLAGTLVLSACPFALAASYNDSSVTGGSAQWQAWVSQWDTTATDYTKVSLTPGADETQLNFAWYSKSESGKTATPVVHFGTDKNSLTAFTGTSGQVDTSLTDGVAYNYNHVVVTGLKANTTYYYTVEKNGVQTEVQEYKTGSFDSVKILYVGDPQIGASKGQTQGSDTLKGDSGAGNTAARNDSFAWNRTLEIASAQNPDLNFIISAGDQVNKTGKAKEEEYAGYLSASVLAGLPVATTIGNHDSLNPDYSYHFNNPNNTGYGETEAGGDYYYSYGEGLFIVLNTNNYNVAEHEKTIQQAVASDPDATWRIVTIHQDIYGTGLDHSDTDGMILRTQLTPIFDKYDIDVVLQGHDHTYSRSKLLYGDGQTHGTYEFRLNDEGTDYDWNNAYNTQTDEKIPLYPEESDTAGTAAHDAFQADNGCYTIEDTTGNTVVNPKGTLYMTANSASGSKFYELIAAQQDYIAARSQNWLPSYSVIEMDDDSFSIITYQVTETGKTEAIDDAFTIQKTDGADVATLTAGGQTYYRLRDAAAAVNGTASQFNVVWNNGVVLTTGAAYTDAVPSSDPTTGSAVSLTLSVDGKSVTTGAMLANGNYYVTADFLATLGVSLGA
ncbi:purple acid phosphatase family protein [Intestinimonas massiliensis (ex Afouda et al. 2020)]|uniref:purple acid phosphatase family protein n=1 Tax=Intestinimonas massiliensis (ex Afouda et al. 2020) TaxID=1673721 RepID=UPI00103064EE|nr:metallophosphoesterase family protein [Intestinimonas massiliensis (ex Afouda et al. 2020)]